MYSRKDMGMGYGIKAKGWIYTPLLFFMYDGVI
jgi:hypothetical protein